MKWSSALVSVLTLLAASPAGAAVVTFSDRAAFDAAARPDLAEDFNAITSDTLLDVAGAVIFDFMSVAMVGDGAPGSDRIDVPEGGAVSIDGTPFVLAFADEGRTLILSFDRAVTAFGATFSELEGAQLFADGVLVPRAGAVEGFFGFTSDVGFTQIEFRSEVLDAFFVDNVVVRSAAAAVPEPAAWALMIAGFGMAGTALRRGRRTPATPAG